MEPRRITLAIHTYDRALELKALLEQEGVEVMLQNVNLDHPVIASGVRVRIKEADLPLALRLVENAEIFLPDALKNCSAAGSTGRTVLVPVDFSPHSFNACLAAFRLANSLKADIVLIHTFVDPAVTSSLQLSDSLTFDSSESELSAVMSRQAHSEMSRLQSTIKEKIKSGELPPVRFTTEIREGVPEEVINTFAKQLSPVLIVMGTRGADTKERELIGSVTAEVLDTCRFPVLTLPPEANVSETAGIRSVVFFCTFTQEDLLALDMLRRLLPEAGLSITLVNTPAKKQQVSEALFATLLRYCRENYPAYSFSHKTLQIKNAEEELRELLNADKTDLIVAPNRKRNIFTRLFNPGLAHRLLFRTDTPMIVLPV